MIFRAISVVMTCCALCFAYLQLNDPDPERWTAMYLAWAVVASLASAGRPAPRMALVVTAIASAWALAIFPELVGTWKPSDLTATMIASRPEIEYGRELCGLLIVAAYCSAAYVVWRRAEQRTSSAQHVVSAARP